MVDYLFLKLCTIYCQCQENVIRGRNPVSYPFIFQYDFCFGKELLYQFDNFIPEY